MNKKKGTAPINCRVTYDGIEIYDRSINEFCSPEDWNAEKQESKDDIINSKIDLYKSRIRLMNANCISKSLRLTQTLVVRAIAGDTEVQFATIKEVLNAYYSIKESECKAKIITSRSLGSYSSRMVNIIEWLTKEKIINMDAELFSKTYQLSFLEYMYTTPRGKKQEPHCHNYIMKHLQVMKSAFDYAFGEGMIKKDPMNTTKIWYERVKKKFYSKRELDLLSSHTFFSQKLQKVADLFVFASYTGLNYSDLLIFGEDCLRMDENGNEWVACDRFKTSVNAIIPFFPEAKRIWIKYNGQLPMLSNTKYNLYIKEAFEVVGIVVEPTTKDARTSFSNIMANRGYSTDVISKMMGHLSVRTTEKYYRDISPERILLEKMRQTG